MGLQLSRLRPPLNGLDQRRRLHIDSDLIASRTHVQAILLTRLLPFPSFEAITCLLQIRPEPALIASAALSICGTRLFTYSLLVTAFLLGCF